MIIEDQFYLEAMKECTNYHSSIMSASLIVDLKYLCPVPYILLPSNLFILLVPIPNTILTKKPSKWIKNLNAKADTIKLLQGNIDRTFQHKSQQDIFSVHLLE